MSAPRGRCANEENARAFHQGPDTVGVHREAGYIDAALFSMVYHVTPVVVSKAGSIYHVVLNPTSLQLIPAYSSQSSCCSTPETVTPPGEPPSGVVWLPEGALIRAIQNLKVVLIKLSKMDKSNNRRYVLVPYFARPTHLTNATLTPPHGRPSLQAQPLAKALRGKVLELVE